jgi:hypothetical protein
MSRPCSIATGSLKFVADRRTGALTLSECGTGRMLLEVPPGGVMVPSLDGPAAATGPVSVEEADGRLLLRYDSPPLAEAKVELIPVESEDAIDIACSFRVRAATQLNRLDLFPAGTALNFYDVVNFRNRHFTPRTWPELLLGRAGCETETYSSDWQFAPHPTALLLRANEVALFAGALDLPAAFGMRFAAKHNKVRDWFLDYGQAPNGQLLAEGEWFTAPRFRLFLRRGRDPYRMFADFGEMLVRAGSISAPALKHREDWWREPLYCTWIDQVFGAQASIASELQDQVASGDSLRAAASLDDDFVRRAAAVIRREKLPVRTILIDAGWHKANGQWEPHPSRFPDFRRLVDDLHADGFKVVVWWSWAEIAADAVVNPAHLMAGGKLNRHGCRMFDYSLPATRDEYLKPLFRRLFSAEPGCFDVDGIKTDFLADKVHADMPVHDPAWRGEENYFVRLTRFFYDEMKRHKPDAVHIGCAGHYWLAEFIDINRTYDVHSSNWREHEERARMLMATAPGCPVAYDFHNFLENLDRWFESARALEASVELGNLMWVKENLFAEARPADAGYWDLLRRQLHHQQTCL